MLLNLKHLIISGLLFFIIVFCSCSNNKNDLSKVFLITNKKVIIDIKNVSSSSKYRFKNNYYPIERDVYFDINGNIEKIGVAKAEGLLFYYREPSSNQLGLNEYQQNFKIRIDRINNIIIENNDTISSFEVDYENKTIYNKNQKE